VLQHAELAIYGAVSAVLVGGAALLLGQASIKEIVVIAGSETPEDDFEHFRNAMIEIGREREPAEAPR
jgi:hypothetical protein